MKKVITEEQRENFNAAQIGWGTRKVIETKKTNGERREAPLIIPQTFISICGIDFDISVGSLETIIMEAIELKLDIYHKTEGYGMITCSDVIYGINKNEPKTPDNHF